MNPKCDTSASNGKTASILKKKTRNSRVNCTQEIEGSDNKSGRFKKNTHNISANKVSSSNIFGESQPATGFMDSDNIIDASNNNYKFENLSHFGMLNN